MQQSHPKLKTKIEEYELLRSNNLSDFNTFANLANHRETSQLMTDYQNIGSYFCNYHQDCEKRLTKHTTVETEYKGKHTELTEACKNLISNLTGYVILK